MTLNEQTQVDGGRTFTEPTCIMTGKPEGQENVSHSHTRSVTYMRCNVRA